MSSYAGWRGLTIVGPIDSRGEELIGGLRNAMERGQTLAQAKQSYLNAGYSLQEVESAMARTGGISKEMVMPENPNPLPLPPNPVGNTKMLPISQNPLKKKNLKFILLAVVAAIILAGGALLFVFWESLFGG